jgi:uncharacterized membrane protein
MKKVFCRISGKEINVEEAYKAESINESLLNFIKREHPELNFQDYISLDIINDYRRKYLSSIIQQEIGESSVLEKEVLQAIEKNQLLSVNIEPEIQDKLTTGQRIADKIAAFGGSWTFIFIFFSFILGWMVINVVLLIDHSFDPFPFILLNLILSCLAAIQAPVIMMSQNRQEQKDRIRSEHDYKINLKAELEIQLLHEKIDHLITHQSKRLLEIQEIQADYLEDILKHLNASSVSGKSK